MKLITIERAVKLVLNLDYIPEYEPLLEITDMIAEDAQEEYQYDASPHNKLRLEICNARHITAQLLFDHIKNEMSLDNSTLKTDSTHSQIVQESFVDWAFNQYGIDIIIPKPQSNPKLAWRDVKIKIYKDFKIGLFIKGKPNKYSHFNDIGLMGVQNTIPNEQGKILIKLSKKIKVPPVKPAPKDIAAMSKLRHCLRNFSGITTDPFYRFNEGDGWRPRFKLIDAERTTDERAKNEATHISYDDNVSYTPDFNDEEDDEAGIFLRNHQ
jgi:hypothetical protein